MSRTQTPRGCYNSSRCLYEKYVKRQVRGIWGPWIQVPAIIWDKDQILRCFGQPSCSVFWTSYLRDPTRF